MLRSPLITHLSWGRIEAEGLQPAKDLKLHPGGGRPWDWGETGTRHDPGIQLDDVLELLEHGSKVVVLSRGMHLALRTTPQVMTVLEERGVEVHVLETKAAAERYNQLAAAGPVGGLFHSTC